MTDLDVLTTPSGVDVLQPGSGLTTAGAPQLIALVTSLVERGRTWFVVDLSQTEHIDSSGLAALLSCLRTARRAGGDLKLSAPTEQVRTVLDRANLSDVLGAEPSVDDAVAAIA